MIRAWTRRLMTRRPRYRPTAAAGLVYLRAPNPFAARLPTHRQGALSLLSPHLPNLGRPAQRALALEPWAYLRDVLTVLPSWKNVGWRGDPRRRCEGAKFVSQLPAMTNLASVVTQEGPIVSLRILGRVDTRLSRETGSEGKGADPSKSPDPAPRRSQSSRTSSSRRRPSHVADQSARARRFSVSSTSPANRCSSLAVRAATGTARKNSAQRSGDARATEELPRRPRPCARRKTGRTMDG